MSKKRKDNPGNLRYLVGDRLRTMRKVNKLTLKQVAEGMGTSFVTVQRFETGEQTIDIDWLEKFAEFYQVPVETLVTWKFS